MEKEKRQPVLLCMYGLPGSGKSYYSRYLATALHAQVISSDGIRERMYGDASIQANPRRVFDEVYKEARYHLSHGRNVIIDSTALKLRDRMNTLSHVSSIPCRKICLQIDTPYEVALKQNSQRSRVVPTDAMEYMHGINERPSLSEGWDRIYSAENERDITNIAEDIRIEQMTPSHGLSKNAPSLDELMQKAASAKKTAQPEKKKNPSHTYDPGKR